MTRYCGRLLLAKFQKLDRKRCCSGNNRYFNIELILNHEINVKKDKVIHIFINKFDQIDLLLKESYANARQEIILFPYGII